MANEAVIVELNRFATPVSFTVDNTEAVEKGTIMYMTDPKTCTKTTGTGHQVFAGIAATEKVASDGQVKLGLWVPGQNNIFDLYTAGTITVGTNVVTSGANTIGASVDADFEAGIVIGQALEAAAAGTPEVIQVRV